MTNAALLLQSNPPSGLVLAYMGCSNVNLPCDNFSQVYTGRAYVDISDMKNIDSVNNNEDWPFIAKIKVDNVPVTLLYGASEIPTDRQVYFTAANYKFVQMDDNFVPSEILFRYCKG